MQMQACVCVCVRVCVCVCMHTVMHGIILINAATTFEKSLVKML